MKVPKSRQTGCTGLVSDTMIAELHSQIFPRLEYLKNNPITYVMGIDTADPMANAYCLGYHQKGILNIIISKSEPESKSFTEEIKNLSKYFNAAIYKEI